MLPHTFEILEWTTQIYIIVVTSVPKLLLIIFRIFLLYFQNVKVKISYIALLLIEVARAIYKE